MLNRAAVLEALALGSSDQIVVAALGNASRELYGLDDHESRFYMLGSMGMPVPFGLGVALGTSRRVVVLEGDGGCLMNLGALATVTRYAPDNLSVLCRRLPHGIALSAVGAGGCERDRLRKDDLRL